MRLTYRRVHIRSFVAVGDSFTEGLDDLRPYGTPRGWADMVADVLDGLASNGLENNAEVERGVNERVRELCQRFPIYQG